VDAEVSGVAADPAAGADGAEGAEGAGGEGRTDVPFGADAAVSGAAGAVLPGTEPVADGVVVGVRPAHLRITDGAADDFPVAEENVAADVRPANTSDDNGRPSWPIRTGDRAPVPVPGAATTGTARTRAVTTVLSIVPSASRPLRCPEARRPRTAHRRSASATRADSGGPAGM
jgi:hypothetical protein